MTIIYHYTDLSGLKGIIENKKLWLSLAYHMNDHQEVHWARNKFYKLANQISDDTALEKLKRFSQLANINRHDPYICSFSKNGDLLSQWRAYASDGNGVAIGFNSDYFGFTSEFPTTSAVLSHSIALLDVVYDENSQDTEIKSLIEQITSFEPTANFDEDNFHILLVNALNKLCYIFKNPAFQEEQEARIIHTPLIASDANNSNHIMGGVSDIHYRVSQNKLTPYFELGFSPTKSQQAIEEIIIGPKTAISDYEMGMFLSIHGLGHTKYHWSQASYR